MLKRLTGATGFCARIDCLAGPPGGSLCESGTCYPRQVYERLRYYEDLEEAGRYIVLAEPERAGVDRLRKLAEADLAGHAEIVVHCRDCKYYSPSAISPYGLCRLGDGSLSPRDDGYCWLAEKKPKGDKDDG